MLLLCGSKSCDEDERGVPMKVLATIVPVFFMIALGILSNRKNLVSDEQANGMYAVISKILVPIMVFNAIFTSNIEVSALYIIVVVFFLHISGIVIGKLTDRFIGKEYSHITPFLMSTVDGGNICFPLYATIVWSSYIGNIVLLDIANMFIVFLIIPLIVSTSTSHTSDIKVLLKNILHNPIVITLLLAFTLKLLGVYTLVSNSSFIGLYDGVVQMAIAPIVGVILFMIGYQFKIEKSSVGILIKCIFLRFLIMLTGIIVLLLLFPHIIDDRIMLIALLLYFMCPPALILQVQIRGLFKSNDEVSFISAFTSLYIVITLIAYILIVSFV
jgi:predicted permease